MVNIEKGWKRKEERILERALERMEDSILQRVKMIKKNSVMFNLYESHNKRG